MKRFKTTGNIRKDGKSSANGEGKDKDKDCLIY